jgi:hypothetical protein
MNLLENSFDYLINSLELYQIADESGVHTKEKSNLNNKSKWKLSFVSMVQAFELLLKYGLYLINPSLLYSDIDSKRLSKEKTVTFSVALVRLSNFGRNPFSEEEEMFITKCFKTRNQFIHYSVEIRTEEIKNTFAKMYILYKKGYLFFHSEPFRINKDLKSAVDELEFFADKLTIFRGMEIPKDQINEYKADVEKYCKISYFINQNGEKVKRIAFGEENDLLLKNGQEDYTSPIYEWEYCDDCGAKQGEYHLPGCDLEICPICFDQKLTCDCNLSLTTID